jgi:uncharacterized protein (DUF952 family)
MRPTLHLVPEQDWRAHDPATPWRPAAYDADGFVHCTDGDAAMIATANRFYAADPRRFLVLTVDLDATGSPWRFDDDRGIYPHVYGAIALASVITVRPAERDADGRFVAWGPPEA